MKEWINNCDVSHSLCGKTDEEKILPTRVLQISGSLQAPLVKLAETNGKKGRYCALSHCWGPPKKRPLITTRANLCKHFEGIPLEYLPKTFQEAVTVTRALEIPYLWIDSLCIIQKDVEDWHCEAGRMGMVYANAAIVLAAAASKDGTEGLFTTDRTQTSTIVLPYSPSGVPKGSFSIATGPPGDRRPRSAPLRERGWALQEWYLSKRLLLSLEGGIAWKCRSTEVNERSSFDLLGLDERESWLDVLASFSSKKFTYPSDRTQAVRGIADEMRKTRRDRYIWEYGLWESNIPDQLLWRQAERAPESESLDLPSWSWAATGGKKVWLHNTERDNLDYLGRKWGSCLVNVHGITGSGSLEVSGYGRQVSTELSPILKRSPNQFPAIHFDLEFELLYFSWATEEIPGFLLRDSDSGKTTLGIGVFDSRPISNPFCLFMAQRKRKRRNRMSPMT